MPNKGKASEEKEPPLRFATMKDAKVHIKANKMRVKETHNHTRGVKIQVVQQDGTPRTIKVLSRQ